MKVIFPVQDNNAAKWQLAEGFHNANYACIYDSVEQHYHWLPITDISKKIGNLSFGLKRKGIQTIITHQITVLALGLYAESGLQVYQAQVGSVKDNVEFLNDGKLKKFSMGNAMELQSCSSLCSSCSSNCA